MKKFFQKAKNYKNYSVTFQKPNIGKPLLFFVTMSGLTFYIAEDYKKKKYFRKLGYKIREFYTSLGIRNLTSAESTIYSLCFINIIVFILWHGKKSAPFMERNFLDTFYSKSHT